MLFIVQNQIWSIKQAQNIKGIAREWVLIFNSDLIACFFVKIQILIDI
jgi:hypothetical protein